MLVAKNLTKYIDHRELFEDYSFIIHDKEKVGLIGPNGCGKSTLMRMIMGQDDDFEGSIDKGREKIGYLSQMLVVDKKETIESYLKEYMVRDRDKILKEVGLDDLPKNVEVKKLSGGQKTRLSLGKILLTKPTLILMDEPTNHLDLEGIKWLEEMVKNYRGSVLVVSHDRKFLDNTVDKIMEMDTVMHELHEYKGGYSDYVEQKKVERERWEIDYKQQQKQKRKMEEWIVLKRQQASTYSDPAKGKQLHAMQRRYEREIEENLISRPADFTPMKNLLLKGQVHKDKLVLRVAGLKKIFGEKVILTDVEFEIRGPERIIVSGLNGSGKSTLLKMIVGKLKSDDGGIRLGEGVSVGYFSQEQEGINLENKVIDEYLKGKEMEITQTEARTVLGAFKFSGDDVFKRVGDLSYGERVRLIFAKIASEGNQLLILDEPTNHLDIYSREIIENALNEYQGAIMLVSHDRYFVEQLKMTRELHVAEGKVVEWML